MFILIPNTSYCRNSTRVTRAINDYFYEFFSTTLNLSFTIHGMKKNKNKKLPNNCDHWPLTIDHRPSIAGAMKYYYENKHKGGSRRGREEKKSTVRVP